MQKRISVELKQLQTTPIQGVDVIPDETNVLLWKIIIRGPSESAYQDMKFILNCQIPEDYPFKAPDIKFQTLIYHPNVSDGEICQDIYKYGWQPTKKIATVIEIIKSMLLSPILESPLEVAIAEQYKNNYKAFLQDAQAHYKKQQQK